MAANRRTDRKSFDSFIRGSRVQRVIQDARATLANPTRPETPNLDRSFYQRGTSSRQGTPITLQPIDYSLWSERGGEKGGDTPAVGDCARARVDFNSSPRAGQQQQQHGGADWDGLPDEGARWRDVRSLLPLLAPDHSVDALQEVLAKLNHLVDAIISSTPIEALAIDPRARYLVQALDTLQPVGDSIVRLRSSRIVLNLLMCSGGEGAVTVAAGLRYVQQLYQLSKQKQHDEQFKAEAVVEPVLLLLESTHDLQVLTLAAGTLKNISYHDEVQRSLGTLGAIRVLTAVCKSQIHEVVMAQRDAVGTPLRARVDLLIQVTSALRNLSILASHAPLFIKLGTISVLYPAVFSSLRDFKDIVLNTNRILAKLSHTEECKLVLDKTPSNLGYYLDTLILYQEQLPMVVRMFYTLGNLVQTNDVHRRSIGTGSYLDPLIEIFGRYAAEDEELMQKYPDEMGWPQEVEGGSGDAAADAEAAATTTPNKAGAPRQLDPTALDCRDGEVPAGGDSPAPAPPDTPQAALQDSDDVLVKIVRFLANMAISNDVGPVLARDPRVVDPLVRILQRKRVHDSEELLLNAVCCVTNLSYYTDVDGSSPNLVLERQVEVADAIAMLLLHDHVDAVVEVARVFGNFSRDADMREWLIETRIDEACSILIDHSDRRVVLAVCGVLLNYSADDAHVQLFAQHNLLQRLSEVLDVTDQTDLELLCILFKLHYNLSDKGFFDVDAAGGLRQRVIDLLSVAQTLPSSHPFLDEYLDVTTNLIELLTRIVADAEEA